MPVPYRSATYPRPLNDCLSQIKRQCDLQAQFRGPYWFEDAKLVPTGALAEPLDDVIALFLALAVSYALVGGLAAMVYGRARFTEDIDLVTTDDGRRILAVNPEVLRRHHLDVSAEFDLIHDSGERIDIWKDEFTDRIATRAQTLPWRGRAVRIAEVHDLIAMKLRANRPQDDYDISEIVRKTRLDEGLLGQRITPEQWARFQAIKKRIGA
jgi:hypothetical protein